MTNVSTLGFSKNQIDILTNQQSLLESLSMQLATGKKTQKFSGLGNDILSSQRARDSFSNINQYIKNITNSTIRMDIMSSTISEYKAQAQNMSSSIVLLAQESVHQLGNKVTYDDPLTLYTVEELAVGMDSEDMDSEMTNLVNMASDLFDIMVDLLNTHENGVYIFGGADTDTLPLDENGLLDSAISSLITDWKDGTISNDELVSALTNSDTSVDANAITDTTIGFSSALSAGNAGNVTTRVDENIEVDYTVHANESAFRDILVSLAFLKNEDLMPIGDVYTTSTYPSAPDVQGAPGATLELMQQNFYDVFNQVQAMLVDGISQIENIEFSVATANARALSFEEEHANAQEFLATTVSDIEDVNLDEVAVEISVVQTQLEASYAVTAEIQQMSLVNYI